MEESAQVVEVPYALLEDPHADISELIQRVSCGGALRAAKLGSADIQKLLQERVRSRRVRSRRAVSTQPRDQRARRNNKRNRPTAPTASAS